MGDEPLSAETREDLLRRCWMSHDAYWFSAVAGEFGIDAANRLNHRNVRAIGRTEMHRLMKALGAPPSGGLADAMRLFDAARALYVPPPATEADVGPAGDAAYTMRIRRCFVAEDIVRAGIAEVYECAVFDRIEGWHDAWGLPLREPLPAARCALAEGRECVRTFEFTAPPA